MVEKDIASLFAAAAREVEGPVGAMAAELADFARSGLTVLVGAADAQGLPVAGAGYCCVVDAPRGELRIGVNGVRDARLMAALASGGSVSACFTDLEHRSIQAKGLAARIEVPTPQDRAECDRQARGHRDWLAIVGFSVGFANGYVRCPPEELAMVVFAPRDVFDQTPGPRAGEAIGMAVGGRA